MSEIKLIQPFQSTVPKMATEFDYLIDWLNQKMTLLGYGEASWDPAAGNSAVVLDFISGEGPKALSVVMQEHGAVMSCDDSGQGVKVSGLSAYFLRPSSEPLTSENVRKEVQYGTVGGKGLSLTALEHVMKGVVEKQVAKNTELSGQYHRCMATLTDTVHFSDGLTVLYCPSFDFANASEAAQDKDRLQIMESIVIHWTRQIKDVVNNHDSSATAETAGPLDEIEFWKGRAQDLLGIQRQLESPNVIRIIEVLQYAKSNYIGPFQTLTEQIVARATEANDNLKYLESIREQCTLLRTIEPEKLVTILPDLLNRIRLIWSFSAFYNNNDAVCGILRKISNEIIKRFRGHIQIPDVWDGDVEFCIARLQEAITCGIEWKAIYHSTSSAIKRSKSRYGKEWDIDDASIFAQIDAFVQRCRDLIEVCESQMQFVRKSAATVGFPGPVPQFGGTKANEIVEGINGIQASFELQIERLRKLDYSVLDVRSGKWHDDYHLFKNVVKDLEVMFTNVINGAFENNATVAEGVALAETFFRLAKRETVKRCVERKAAEMNQLFLRQVQTSRGEMEVSRNNPPLRLQEPTYAGSALWAHSLGALIKNSYDCLVRLKHILTPRDFDESKEVYTSFMAVIRDFKLARYNAWIDDLNEKAKDNGLNTRLDKPLLRRVEIEGGAKGSTELVCNFDEDLITLFSEVSYWEKFHGEFSIPYIAHDICNKKEQLRVMRENVMVVVRAYNDIVRDINQEERRLFLDHMRKLDRRIGQGLVKLTWQSKNMIEMYVRDCCTNCSEVHAVVKEFKECKTVVARTCKHMSSVLLLRVDKNQVYEGGVFESRQQDHRNQMAAQYDQYFQKIMSILRNIFKNFREGSSEVQREWRSQITMVSIFESKVPPYLQFLYLFIVIDILCCENVIFLSFFLSRSISKWSRASSMR